jgi:hypothetical protein
MAIPPAAPGEVVDVRPWGPSLATTKTNTLLKTGKIEVVRLVMPAGKIVEHKAPGEITVQCLEGRIAFTALGLTHELTAGQMLYLGAGEPHSVKKTVAATPPLLYPRGGGKRESSRDGEAQAVQFDVDSQAGKGPPRQAGTEIFPFRGQRPGGETGGDVSAQAERRDGDLASHQLPVTELDRLLGCVFGNRQTARFQSAGGQEELPVALLVPGERDGSLVVDDGGKARLSRLLIGRQPIGEDQLVVFGQSLHFRGVILERA